MLVTSPNSLLRAPRAGHGSTPRSPRLKDGSRPYMVGGERRLPEKWIDAGFWWGLPRRDDVGQCQDVH